MHRPDRGLHQRTPRSPGHPPPRLPAPPPPPQGRRTPQKHRQKFPGHQVRRKGTHRQRATLPQTDGASQFIPPQKLSDVVEPLLSASESMLANCINQYLNADYEVRKSGDPNDLIDVFLFYYSQINAQTRVRQLTAIKNCQLFPELQFLQDNLSFLLENMQMSLRHVYEREKNKFLSMTKDEGRSLSPEKREEDEKFDSTGRGANKEKRKLQQYCFEMSKVLGLQGLYINYFYFNSMDSEKRKRTLTSNFLKRNLHIQRLINNYLHEYRLFADKQKK